MIGRGYQNEHEFSADWKQARNTGTLGCNKADDVMIELSDEVVALLLCRVVDGGIVEVFVGEVPVLADGLLP